MCTATPNFLPICGLLTRSKDAVEPVSTATYVAANAGVPMESLAITLNRTPLVYTFQPRINFMK
jgi:hypothetical protein